MGDNVRCPFSQAERFRFDGRTRHIQGTQECITMTDDDILALPDIRELLGCAADRHLTSHVIEAFRIGFEMGASFGSACLMENVQEDRAMPTFRKLVDHDSRRQH